MLTNFNDMLAAAYKGGYAIGSYNVYNYETMRGVVAAAEENRTPAIVAFGYKYLENMSLDSAFCMLKCLAEESSTPFCLHLDHCTDIPTIYRALKAGFGSVMYDGSALEYRINRQNTALVCDAAHACGASVEAELGSLAAGAHSHEGSADDREMYTDPAQAKDFVRFTGVDALAVSIGTVHGVYKGKPNVRVDILREINALLKMPLVLHGGSGTPEAAIRECIKNGIAKININTEISMHAVAEIKSCLASSSPHLSALSLKQVEYVKYIVKKYMDFFRN